MEKLFEILTIRFNQRNENHQSIHNLKDYTWYKVFTHKWKKASLFVIYNGETPVQISLNYHFNKILFISIPSFDIAYSKFSLGNISIYKILEWALYNDYDLLDLEYGSLEYKRQWSNHVYSFDDHIIYPKDNYFVSLVANLEIGKLKII